MLKACAAVGDVAGHASSDAERAGAALGGAMASTMIVMLWALGTVILGALTFFSRGDKIVVEEEVAN